MKLKKDDGISKLVDPTLCQSIVGSLLYVAVATRPDISQAVRVVSKYCSSLSEAHLTAAKIILRHLKETANVGIKYEKTKDNTLIGYSDADWAGDLDDRHSTSGNIFLLFGGPVCWLRQQWHYQLQKQNMSR